MRPVAGACGVGDDPWGVVGVDGAGQGDVAVEERVGEEGVNGAVAGWNEIRAYVVSGGCIRARGKSANVGRTWLGGRDGRSVTNVCGRWGESHQKGAL